MDNDKIEINKTEYQELKKMKIDSELNTSALETFKVKIAEQEKTITALNATIAEKEKVTTEFATFKMNVEKEKENSLKSEAESYITEKIQAQKIKPAYKDRLVSDYIRLKKDEKLFAEFKEDIENRGQVINLGESAINSQGANLSTFKYDPDKVEFHEGDTINYDEITKIVELKMKEKGITYDKAMIECGFVKASELDQNGRVSDSGMAKGE